MSEDRWTELDELLMDRATGALEPREENRLQQLMAEANEADPERYDLLIGEIAAAWIDLTGEEPMPDSLARRIEMAADPAGGAPVEDAEPEKVSAPSEDGADVVPLHSRSWVGWAVAAGLALAGVGSSVGTGGGEPVAEGPPVDPTAREQFMAMASQPGVLQWDWSTTDDPTAEGARGAVVWNQATQEGFMRFSGLAPNNPSEFQYQLWIFDGSRDDRFPVDGGVFDIPAGADEVYVPISAQLAVRDPALFAVTVERPGGVVVSDRERISVLAQPATGEE